MNLMLFAVDIDKDHLLLAFIGSLHILIGRGQDFVGVQDRGLAFFIAYVPVIIGVVWVLGREVPRTARVFARRVSLESELIASGHGPANDSLVLSAVYISEQGKHYAKPR